MGHARFLWLLVPIAGLAELALFVRDAQSAPRVAEWEALRGEVAKLKAASDLLVVAPAWADPLARHAFGDALMPIRDVARADMSSYARAVEVAELGASAAELDGWRVREERTVGRFQIRLRDNPAPAKVLFSFIDHARPPFLDATDVLSGAERPCTFSEHANLTAGGLHGHLAFPRERFNCAGGEEFFVGVTVLDDQDYRPRRCLWAHPPISGSLRLSYANVPIGRKIHGYAGLSYFIFRDGAHGPVTLSVRVAGQEVGQYLHRDEWGWHGFELDTQRFAGQTTSVDFEIQSDDPSDRQFCFYADTR